MINEEKQYLHRIFEFVRVSSVGNTLFHEFHVAVLRRSKEFLSGCRLYIGHKMEQLKIDKFTRELQRKQ